MLSVVATYTLKADNPQSTLPGHDFISRLRRLMLGEKERNQH